MSNENSKLEIETGVTPYPIQTLTDSGDAKTFTSNAVLFSEDGINAPVIRPNGLLTGGVASIAASGSNNVIDLAALTMNLNGVVTSVTAGVDVAVTRASTDVASISSITINSSGVVTVIKGVDSTNATLSETRGAAGGPAFIPVGSVEIAQVRTTTNVAGVFTMTEIFQTVGTHLEKADFPVFTVDNFNATVAFNTPLPLSHTGSVAKAVYASYADPIFAEQNFANDFVPAENSHSVTSEQVYGATVGTSATTLGQGSFTAILKDGITDTLIGLKNKTLFFKYSQDRTKAPHILSQGKLGLARTFNASDNPKVSCTISADAESIERAS